MPRLLLSLPFTLPIRSLVGTGLSDVLQKEVSAELHAISPYDQEAHESPAGSRIVNYPVPITRWDKGIPELAEMTALDRMLNSIHLSGFATEFPDGSLQNIQLSERHNAQWLIARALTAAAPRKSALRRALRNVYSHYRPQRPSVAKAFDTAQPSTVLVSSPGHFWLDRFVLDEAKRRKIPSLCIVLSWDNLYSRGPLVRRPDYLLVWSEEMAKQAVDVHQFPSDRIKVVGAMQFVPYARPVNDEEIAAMRARIGLRADENYIAYVCGARTSAYDVEDIRAMVATLRRSRYCDHRVVVRPHPQGKKEEYGALREMGVLLDSPPDLLAEGVKADAMDYAAMRHMASFLRDARFVVSSWGTTALLEACIFDTPAVQLRWMDSVSHQDTEQVKTVRNFQRYIHMRAFDELEARPYCDRPEDLESIFANLQECGKEFASRRARTVDRLTCRPFDGVPTRVAEAVKEAIGCPR